MDVVMERLRDLPSAVIAELLAESAGLRGGVTADARATTGLRML
jgi:hypothetical protein